MNRIQKLLIGIIIIVALIGTSLIIMTITNYFPPNTPTISNTTVSDCKDSSNQTSVFIQKQLDLTPKKSTSRFQPLPYIFANNFYNEAQMDQLYGIVDPSQQTFRFSMQFSNDVYDHSFLVIDIYVQGNISTSWIKLSRILNVVIYESYVTNNSLLKFDGNISASISEESNLNLIIDGSLYENSNQPCDSFNIENGSMTNFYRTYNDTEGFVKRIIYNISLSETDFESGNYAEIDL